MILNKNCVLTMFEEKGNGCNYRNRIEKGVQIAGTC
jgi:hypothetical protein